MSPHTSRRTTPASGVEAEAVPRRSAGPGEARWQPAALAAGHRRRSSAVGRAGKGFSSSILPRVINLTPFSFFSIFTNSSRGRLTNGLARKRNRSIRIVLGEEMLAGRMLPPQPSPAGGGGSPPCWRRTGGGCRRDLLRVLFQEVEHRLVGHFGVALLIVEIGDLDVAARLAVVVAEPLGPVAREAAVGIVVVVHLVGPALDPD